MTKNYDDFLDEIDILNNKEALNKVLDTAFYRPNCPDPMILGHYALNFLEQAEMSKIKAHLLDCWHCQAALERMSDFLPEKETETALGWVTQAIQQISQGKKWLDNQVRGFRYAPLEGGQIIIQLIEKATSSPTLAPVRTGGVRGTEKAKAIVAFTLQHGQGKDRFEIKLEAYPSETDPQNCTVQAKVNIRQYRRDLSGMIVQLTAENWPGATSTTNKKGGVLFEDIPIEIIKHLTVAIDPSR